MARCFLHYWVILSICLSYQNVLFRIRILRKITVTQCFLKDRSEDRVPNFALDSVSAGGIFFFFQGGNFDLNAQYLMREFNFHIQSLCIAGWKLLSFCYFWKKKKHFVISSVFMYLFNFKDIEHFLGKKYI